MTHKENQLELVVGGDGYHRILRIIEFSWDTDRDPPKPGKIIEEITAMIKYEAAQFERDWRFVPYKFLKLNAKGEWSGEIVSWPVALGINEWDSDESALIGWKYALNILEDTEDIFSDSWFRAMLFQTWPGDIKGTDDQIVRACLGVGYLLRDWEFKQRHGPKVTSRIKSNMGLIAARAERKISARGNAPLWREEAIDIAKALRLKNPKRSATNIAQEIEVKMADGGYETLHGISPLSRSERTIRDTIMHLWRE